MALLAVYKHPVELVLQKSAVGFLGCTEMVGHSFQGCGADPACSCWDSVCQIHIPERNAFNWSEALKAWLFFYVSFSLSVSQASFLLSWGLFCFALIAWTKLNLSGRCLVFPHRKMYFLSMYDVLSSSWSCVEYVRFWVGKITWDQYLWPEDSVMS